MKARDTSLLGKLKRYIDPYKNRIEQLNAEIQDLKSKNNQLSSKLGELSSASLQKTEEIEGQFYQTMMQNVIDTALDAVIITSGTSIVIEWNRQAEVIFGYTREEALGKNLAELIIPEMHQSAHEAGVNRYHETKRGPVLNKQIEVPAKCKDGSEILISLFITPVEMKGEIIFSSFIRNITHQKFLQKEVEKQQEINSSILNALPIVISLKNSEHKYIFSNRFMLEQMGLQQEDLLGKTDFDLYPKEHADHTHQQDIEIWSSGQTLLEEQRIERNGRTQHLLSGKYLVKPFEDDRTSQFLLSFCFDITEQKRAQEQLIKALKTKDEFLSTMSHEIRTPLHSIVAISELLQKKQFNAEEEELVNTLFFSSNHLLGLINDILDFARINSGKLALEKRPFDLSELLQKISRQSEILNKRNVNFTFEGVNLPAVRVLGDSLRLNQVLSNLLSNAFKFTHQGFVKLKVVTTPISNHRVRIDFYVIDSGIGIKASNLELINEAFTQENSSISRKYGGTGLGLSIVNSLLKMCGSQLHIQSEFGAGSTFSFTYEFELEVKQNELNIEEKEHSPTAAIKVKRILYVEDMLPNQMVMAAIVKQLGIDISMANSAMEALELCASNAYDLILMDIQMPEIDGTQALKMLHEKYPEIRQIPAIAFTANASKEEIDFYLGNGFVHVLTKPITPSKFTQFLSEIK
jgi:PAS domain S-box-containing protein